MSLERRNRAEEGKEGARVWLSVVVPACNEARRIGETLRSILAYLDSRAYVSEVIVVDDGSKDGTRDVAAAALSGRTSDRVLTYCPNGGKGSGARRGILRSRGK